MQEIQDVVEDVRERISEYEEMKGSIVEAGEPDVNVPYISRNLSSKSTSKHRRGGSSSLEVTQRMNEADYSKNAMREHT